MSRSVACLALVSLLVLVSGAPEGEEGDGRRKLGEDLVTCDSKTGDQILSFLEITDQGHNLGKGYLDVVYPPEGEPENEVINCIMVKDLKPEWGATASLTNGTIGDKRVVIHLESSFTKGLSFSIKLLGQ